MIDLIVILITTFVMLNYLSQKKPIQAGMVWIIGISVAYIIVKLHLFS